MLEDSEDYEKDLGYIECHGQLKGDKQLSSLVTSSNIISNEVDNLSFKLSFKK